MSESPPPNYHESAPSAPRTIRQKLNHAQAESELRKRVARNAEEKVVESSQMTEPVPANSGPSTMESITASAGALASSMTSLFQPSSEPHELWSFTNALFFIILIILVIWIAVYGMSTFVNIQHIKDDWANQRCSPTIMPFAGFFGYNTKDNFDFCMGQTFQTHSMPYLGSI
jgi:hypothetical protein